MEVYPPANPELVPEIQGPFYEGAQVRFYALFSVYPLTSIFRIY